MDIALKQRLVGASVLVALGVIFIPMLLDGSDDPGRREVAVTMPEKPPFSTRRYPVEGAGTDASAATADSGSDSSAHSGTDSTTRSDAPDRPEPRSLPASTKPVIERQTPDQLSLPAPGAAPATVEPQTTRAEPVIVSSTSGGQGGSGWILQLGSFGNAANASKVVADVSAAGYNAYQDRVTVGGRTLHRVRVGHWLDKADAASAGNQISARFPDYQASLQWDGKDGKAAPSQPLRGFMVQVGAFGKQANALGLRDKLRGAGYSAHVENTADKFRVLVGPELNRASAEQRRDALKSEMKLSGIVVTHP